MKFAALSALSLAAATNPWEAPSFCHDLDCPSYTTRQVDGDVEVRQYDSLLWASTDVESDSVSAAGSIAFGRLFGYLSGANANSQKIDMTAPVLNKVSPGAGPNCNNTFTVSFFVPWEYQTEEGPPAPTADDVYIETKKFNEFAVSTFGGFADDDDVVEEASKLAEEIEGSSDVEMGEDDNTYYFVGYDSPYTLFNRHNEDWLEVHDL